MVDVATVLCGSHCFSSELYLEQYCAHVTKAWRVVYVRTTYLVVANFIQLEYAVSMHVYALLQYRVCYNPVHNVCY